MKAVFKFIGFLLLCLALFAGVLALGAFSFMLAVGAAHIEWWPVIPLISYRSAVLITIASSPITGLTAILTFIINTGDRRR